MLRWLALRKGLLEFCRIGVVFASATKRGIDVAGNAGGFLCEFKIVPNDVIDMAVFVNFFCFISLMAVHSSNILDIKK